MQHVRLHLIPHPTIVARPPDAAPFEFKFCPEHAACATALDWAEYLMALAPSASLSAGMRRQSLADWVRPHGPLPDGFDPEQGYALAVAADGITVAADTDAGFRHALQTLAQLLAQACPGPLPAVNVIDWPVMRRRCAHVCYHLAVDWMPESVPDFDALLRLIKLAAHFKMNFLLLEIEAMFPHQKHEKIPACDAFSMEQIREIGRVCAAWGLEIVPLLQSLGHAYHVLCHPEYAHLRETPDTTQQYCPSNQAVLPFYLELMEEIRMAFPGVKKFHIGGDESRRLGVCPECAAAVKRDGVGALYGKHIGAVARAMLERGLTPLVWSDIIEHYPDAAGFIPAGTEFVYWKYALPRNGTPVDFEPFMRQGATWAAVGVRFGTCNSTMYRFPEAMQGISFLAGEAQRAGCDGFIATDWMKAIPFELSEPGYAYAAEVSWGARRALRDFFDHYAALLSAGNAGRAPVPPAARDGAGQPHRADAGDAATHPSAGKSAGAALIEIFSLLSFPLIPFCEDAQTHQTGGGLDRYDLSGLTFRERIARQMDVAEKGQIISALNEGLANAGLALDIISALRPRLAVGGRLLDLLELSAQTNAHKARLGLAVEQAVRLLKYPCPDDAPARHQLAEQFEDLMAEHDLLRNNTQKLLAPVMFAGHLAANLDVKFEPAARDWMLYFQGALRKGAPVRFVLGPECAPAPAR